MEVAIRKILFATDFSETSQQAQKYASAMAAAFQAELHALHVIRDPYPMPSSTGFPLPPPKEMLPKLTREAETRLAEEMADVTKSYPQVIRAIRVGDAVREINEYAKLHDIDLIVIGTHGLTGISHLLIGSVAEKLVRLATCPVFTVHKEGHQFVG